MLHDVIWHPQIKIFCFKCPPNVALECQLQNLKLLTTPVRINGMHKALDSVVFNVNLKYKDERQHLCNN